LALETRYAARLDWPVDRIVESLAGLLAVRRRPLGRGRIAFFDTPDGRIGRAGACLTFTAESGCSRMEWRHGSVRAGAALERMVDFPWELEPGTLRQRVEAVAGTRRLLPVAEVAPEGAQLDVMDEAGKTIARLGIVAGRARAAARRSPWQALPPFLTLSALRGYDAQCAGALAIIASRPGLQPGALSLQAHVLQAIGVEPPQDVSVYRVEFDPEVCADVGSRQAQRELLRILLANEAGAVDAVDCQFLHDFRAALLRVRTLLAHLPAGLPSAEHVHLEAELAWLDGITAPAGALDVLLTGLRAPVGSTDATQHRRVLEHVERLQADARHTLAAQLTGERYRRLMRRWQALLADERPGAHDGRGPALLKAIVSARASQLHERMLSDIGHVRAETSAHELQRIRVDARMLGDLLGIAASLYDPEDLASVQRALGSLQSTLGELDDACAQASWLRQQGEGSNDAEHDVTSSRPAAAALAARAQARAAQLRKAANRQLLRFGTAATRASFDRIFQARHSIGLVQ
jgi:CHAD domain-containing protein